MRREERLAVLLEVRLRSERCRSRVVSGFLGGAECFFGAEGGGFPPFGAVFRGTETTSRRKVSERLGVGRFGVAGRGHESGQKTVKKDEEGKWKRIQPRNDCLMAGNDRHLRRPVKSRLWMWSETISRSGR